MSNNELVQYARRGSLVRVGQGVWCLARQVPTESDPRVLAVKLVGPGAYLFGEAVIVTISTTLCSLGKTSRGTTREQSVRDAGRFLF